MDWIGENGFGATTKCSRGRLPVYIEGQCLHQKTSDKTKVARFFNTAVSTKNTEKIEEKNQLLWGGN